MSPELADLIARATAFDGNPPFSDGALVALANGERELVWEYDAEGNRVGAALDSPTASEFVVDPDARGHGHGARMLDMLTHPSRGGAAGSKLFWAHGDHPGARALAVHHRLEPVRRLLHLRLSSLPKRRTLGAESAKSAGRASETGQNSVISEGSEGVTAFTLADADAWVALNARTFAEHPEQGAITRADLDVTMAEPWFDASDFLLLREGSGAEGGELVGYVWLKVLEETGEFYVVGVAPEQQGKGLGRVLMDAGFARLAEHGIHTAELYVEADNAPALRLYRGYGFTEHSVDVQYHYVR